MRCIHHVAIICADYARSKHFYSEILGLKIVRETYREERSSWKCDLDAGNAQIELFSFPSPPPRVSGPEACGLRHLAFTVADLAAELDRLKRFGVIAEPIRRDDNTGKLFTFFADPDGLPLELYEEITPGQEQLGQASE